MNQKDIRKILIYALIVGIIADLPTLLIALQESSFSFVFGFFVISPATVLLLISILKVFGIRNKIFIVTLTTLLFFLAMIFGFYQWIELRGQGTDMSSLLYFIGSIPSVILGLIFGFHLAKKINS